MVDKPQSYELLCQFIRKEMALPFHMHGVHREVILALQNTSEPLTLAVILKIMANAFPFCQEWMSFAADTTDLFSTRGHFVEKSDQAELLKLIILILMHWYIHNYSHQHSTFLRVNVRLNMFHFSSIYFVNLFFTQLTPFINNNTHSHCQNSFGDVKCVRFG